jgi:thiamine biosynthesis lipoprotein
LGTYQEHGELPGLEKSSHQLINLKRALDLSGYQHLRLTGYKKAKLEKKGVILDLGGVAKGFAADRMMVKLNQMGITKCLIDAGGDLSLGDPPAGREGWVVKIGNSNNTQLRQLKFIKLLSGYFRRSRAIY